jgi:predicted MFS family arabinose efflux permease
VPLKTIPAVALAVLFFINALNFYDRTILAAVGEPIRREWALSDSALGGLGTAFTLLYALVGLPLGRLADRASRTRMLVWGVLGWSVLTAVSGLARTFWQLFAARLGVGVGEATCAPAATSLISDLYPPGARARALSVFMMGLPVGIALSYAASSLIAHQHGWRAAFLVAGVPGVLGALAMLAVREPSRGAADHAGLGDRHRPGNPYRLVLSVPTVRWLILSGALHNFNMYALASFLSPFMIRYHGADLRTAGFLSMLVFGLSGIPGLLLGGLAGDAVLRSRSWGRLQVGTLAISLSVPLVFCSLGVPRGDLTGFAVLLGLGCGLMYVYYSTVYATLHDVIEPSLRGTAMALYFFAMYVIGASLGPIGTGMVSDAFTQRAAAEAGMDAATGVALEPFRGPGLHAAMYLLPVLGAALALVLFAGSRTVARDARRLREWMDELSPPAEQATIAKEAP